MSPGSTPVEAIHLGSRALPDVIAEVDAAIERAVSGAAVDLVTALEVVAKYAVPAAAVRGARAGFRRDPGGGWRIELRPGRRRRETQATPRREPRR